MAGAYPKSFKAHSVAAVHDQLTRNEDMSPHRAIMAVAKLRNVSTESLRRWSLDAGIFEGLPSHATPTYTDLFRSEAVEAVRQLVSDPESPISTTAALKQVATTSGASAEGIRRWLKLANERPLLSVVRGESVDSVEAEAAQQTEPEEFTLVAQLRKENDELRNTIEALKTTIKEFAIDQAIAA